MKQVRVILSEEVREVFEYLNQEAPEPKIERSILNAINQKMKLVKQNPHFGNPISKKLIPREYVEKYGI